uniref:Uncharacterized protein n=1 Tax=Aegilops tauschii subsp. strangulata TaxID=200361 RepID=A0A453HVX3_AEGTS
RSRTMKEMMTLLPCSLAFSSPSCWISAAMLYNGMDLQHFASPATKGGSGLNCHGRGSIHPAISPGPCPSVYHRSRLPNHPTA